MVDNIYNYQMLSHKHWKFVIEYCVDFNATQAAIRAGYDLDSAGQVGHELLKNHEIAEAIEERKKDLAAAAAIKPEWVLRQWLELAKGNPADYGKLKRVNCRHCHGYDGNYQWTEFEYRKALNEAIDNGEPGPDASGGFGFNSMGEPNQACTECNGEGVERLYLVDTDKVQGRSRGLFAGIKMTTNGPEIKLRDQDAALKNLAAYLGMSVDRKEISGPGGGPIGVVAATKEMTDDQLDAFITTNTIGSGD